MGEMKNDRVLHMLPPLQFGVQPSSQRKSFIKVSHLFFSPVFNFTMLIFNVQNIQNIINSKLQRKQWKT